MTFTGIHGYVLGFAVIGAWAVICFWALALRLLRYEETPTFWRAVSVAQVLLVVQLVAGAALLALGRRPGGTNLSGWSTAFHILYGVGFPLIVLLVGHQVARAGRYNPHAVFSVVGLVVFGLTARAWMVGLTGF
jgi:hypothetical protein